MTGASKEQRYYTEVEAKPSGSCRGNKGDRGHVTAGLVDSKILTCMRVGIDLSTMGPKSGPGF